MQILQFLNKQNKGVKNHFIILDGDKQYFQSYNSIICEVDRKNKHITLYNNYDYSATTLKHLYSYLNDFTFIELNKNELQKCLDVNKIGMYTISINHINKSL